MIRRILFILPLFLWIHSTAFSQDQVGCTQLLEDAREAYAAGMVELVPELLLPCIESGLSGTPKQEAYKLVINAYLFDYLPDEADKLMSDFLDENPDYIAQASDPAEFKLLLEAHKQRRAEEAAALVAAARARQLEEEAVRQQAAEQSKAQKKSQGAGSALNNEKPRLGFVAGFSGSKGAIMESYSVGDPELHEGKYAFAPGFLLGAKVDLPLSKTIEIGLGLQFARINLKYSATPFDFISYTYHEGENRIQLPLSMLVYLNPKGQTRAYFRVGVVPDYLLSAAAYGTRTYDESATYLRDVELETLSISDTRSRLNMQGLFGAGISIPLQNAFLSFEASYSAGFFQSNKGQNRYDNQDIVWILYHVDSNFRVNQILLNVGMTWNLN